MPKKIYKLDPYTINILIDEGLITEAQIYKLIKHKHNDNDGQLMTISESIIAFTQVLSKNSSKTTISNYRQYVESFLKFFYNTEDIEDIGENILKDVKLNDIEKWFTYLSSIGYKDSSFFQFKSGLTKYFSFLEENGFTLPEISLIKLSKREEPEINAIREDEILQIAESSPTLRGKAIITFMYETAIKRNELTECKKSHIDFDKRTVDIYKRGKFNRVGFLSEEGAKLILYYIRAWEDEVKSINENRKTNTTKYSKVYSEVTVSEYLFQTFVADRISYATIQRDIQSAVQEYCSSNGYDKQKTLDMQEMITSETIRHSRRAYYLSEGVPVYQVKSLIGDTNITETNRYLPLAQKLYPEKFRNS